MIKYPLSCFGSSFSFIDLVYKEGIVPDFSTLIKATVEGSF